MLILAELDAVRYGDDVDEDGGVEHMESAIGQSWRQGP